MAIITVRLQMLERNYWAIGAVKHGGCFHGSRKVTLLEKDNSEALHFFHLMEWNETCNNKVKGKDEINIYICTVSREVRVPLQFLNWENNW